MEPKIKLKNRESLEYYLRPEKVHRTFRTFIFFWATMCNKVFFENFDEQRKKIQINDLLCQAFNVSTFFSNSLLSN